ncbi:hypothetical protein CDD80_2444 [Ophiocordyceps camponoti-rufipedis]|uniref:Uncharacterized protein n=1 Tax=Ophiocordyceps camponoti-rufipedis TaxID=2004952 RepID=A0A2C5XPI4_9HYPO|nr:hypothetical protein CDD80_2444 [Ophiocordyceps camponoti-rufipedis]
MATYYPQPALKQPRSPSFASLVTAARRRRCESLWQGPIGSSAAAVPAASPGGCCGVESAAAVAAAAAAAAVVDSDTTLASLVGDALAA